MANSQMKDDEHHQKMQVKTIVWSHHICLSELLSKNTTNNKCWQGEKENPHLLEM